MDPVEISSTDLRDRAGRGVSIAPFVPGPVLQYIQANKLYKD
jgi:nicotinic acid mononucleotide adenylyltransferase